MAFVYRNLILILLDSLMIYSSLLDTVSIQLFLLPEQHFHLCFSDILNDLMCCPVLPEHSD